MRKNFGEKAYLYPQPVFVIGSYNEDSTPNAMVAAWGCCADFGRITVYLDKTHKSTDNILARKFFTVSFADVEHLKQVDYLGIVSGKKEPNKFEKSGLHAVKSELVDAPIIEEFPLTLECKLVSFDPESEQCIADVVNVSAEEKILGSDGKIDPLKLNAITYDPVHHYYIALGEIVGRAFADGKEI